MKEREMLGKKPAKPRNQIDSLIGTGTHVHGNIKFTGGIRVDGRVTGNITALGDKPSTLVLSDHGIVEGVIQVSHVVINGTVIGAIKASEYVELQGNARIAGDVHYKRMEIHLGASVQGMLLHMDGVEDARKVVPLLQVARGSD